MWWSSWPRSSAIRLAGPRRQKSRPDCKCSRQRPRFPKNGSERRNPSLQTNFVAGQLLSHSISQEVCVNFRKVYGRTVCYICKPSPDSMNKPGIHRCTDFFRYRTFWYGSMCQIKGLGMHHRMSAIHSGTTLTPDVTWENNHVCPSSHLSSKCCKYFVETRCSYTKFTSQV